ncbi:MAG: cation:proton antiporter [Chloroflexi bacterium]|nr:cation:proton antiporter [Chloroflexota bacterium]
MEIFLVILIVIGAARTGGELMERVKLPGLLGELLVGVILGVALLVIPWSGLHILDITDDIFFKGLLDVAIFFLMFMAGLEVNLRDVLWASKVGVPVAAGGVMIPLLLGTLVGWAFLPASEYKFAQTLFLGVALTITAIPVSVRALIDLGHLRSRVGSTIINAAVIDDIAGLVLLSFLTTILSAGGSISAGQILLILGKVAMFLAVSIPVGRYIVPMVDKLLPTTKSAELHFTVFTAFGLAMAVLAEALGMHFIIGAFVGGLMVSEQVIHSRKHLVDMEEKVKGITLGFLAPIFFVSIGLHLDASAFREAAWFTTALLGAAIGGKLLGCSIPALLTGMPWRESLAIGVSMNGRGAVELIVATVALEAGLFIVPEPVPSVVSSMFSAVVIVAITTTLMTPIGLRLLLRPQKKADQ